MRVKFERVQDNMRIFECAGVGLIEAKSPHEQDFFRPITSYTALDNSTCFLVKKREKTRIFYIPAALVM